MWALTLQPSVTNLLPGENLAILLAALWTSLGLKALANGHFAASHTLRQSP